MIDEDFKVFVTRTDLRVQALLKRPYFLLPLLTDLDLHLLELRLNFLEVKHALDKLFLDIVIVNN